MKPLIIFVTRMEGGGEWNELWGFEDNLFVAFVRGQHWAKAEFEDFTTELFEKHLEDDVWVLNGEQISTEHGKNALNQVPWQKLGREFIPLIHRGAGSRIDSPQWQEQFSTRGRDNNRDFFSKALPYSGHLPIFTVIQDFAQSEGTTGNEYEKALSNLYETLHVEQSPLQSVVELLQLFLPLDIQLQLSDAEIAECRREAATLYEKLPDIASLLSKITSEEITLQSQPGHGKADDNDPKALVESLMFQVWRVRESVSREEMSMIFGVRSKARRAKNKKDDSLDPKGFHSTYERLRDTLLNLVERE